MPPSHVSQAAAIRVRMYRVGFGDCFLVSIPQAGSKRHILIDCGVHSRGNIGTMEAVVKQIGEETGGILALVIATHAHQDHISGFAAFEPLFRSFQIGEVWLPWTENPKDPAAVEIKNKHLALAERLVQHFAAQPAATAARLAAQAALENLTGNQEALQFLKTGAKGATVRYLEAGAQFENAAGITGLSARILGPPRDPEFLNRMDPPTDERLLRATPDGNVEAINGIKPFEEKWNVTANTNKYYAAIDERDKSLLAAAAGDADNLALSLDRMMNNTSVVALFTFAQKHLLFPGDAQYGNWESWIKNAGAKDLLGTVNFFKVAHHGSVNASPKSVVESLTEHGFAAMVSTQNQPWDSIPLQKLMDVLKTKSTGVVRSDSIHVAGAPEGPPVGELPPGFQQGEFWFDYQLPV